ncbi:membrane protein [Raoultella ornithinolytica]|uniref:membrane protein n=1 Tax=Raoultella ornithinolytica TaxID=54291 RepID=UPI000598240F|nr:membrane protein [Raoultella ornithinolytica]
MNETNLTNKKIVAKNTFMLYGRMLLIMFATFYTSRIVLNALGVYDFGLYSVVGSIIVLFSFIQNVSALATQRFLSVGLGKGELDWTKKVFSSSIIVHVIICGAVFLFAETIGLWFLVYKLKVPADRISEIFWVYQLSILSLLIQIMQTPFIASLIACEKMDLFAKIGIYDALQRWGMVYLFSVFNFQSKIVWYASFLLIGYISVFLLYYLVCTRKLDICKAKIRVKENKDLLKELLFFSSWSMLGSLSLVGLSQGIALLTYFFVGVVANGAVWLAEQVLVAFNRVIGTLQTAFNPQLIKQHAIGNNNEVSSLLNLSCKLTAFVVLMAAVPAYIDAPFIVSVWLSQVPEHLIDLIRIVIIYVLIDSMSGPFVTIAYAEGKLKVYQIIVSAVMFFSLILTFILYSLGASINVAVSGRIFCALVLLIFRVLYVERVTKISAKAFFFDMLPRLLLVAVACFIGGNFIKDFLSETFTGLLSLIICNSIFIVVLFFVLVLNKIERHYILGLVTKKLIRK